MQKFYHHEFGHFVSNKADLSDLDHFHFLAAMEILHAKEKASAAVASELQKFKQAVGMVGPDYSPGRLNDVYAVTRQSVALRMFVDKPPPGCTCGTCTAARTYLPEDVASAYPIVKAPPAPEKTEAERAWDYLVLAAEASRYNT